MEAFSFGLKFATEIQNGNLVDTIVKSHKHNDSDFNKGFIQALITTMLGANNKRTLSQRHLEAFRNLAKNKEISSPPWKREWNCYHK